VAYVSIALGIMAAVIFIIYGIYFAAILRGNPQVLELEMRGAFAAWLREGKGSGRVKLMILLLASLILEALYFVLAFLVLHNPVMIILTLILAGEELLHLVVVVNSAQKYWQGRIEAERILNWIIERVSAVFFFTHAFLVLVSLILFN
jgi:hypothetical protein